MKAEKDEKIDVIRRVPFFSGLPEAIIEELAKESRFVRFQRNEDIFLEGQPPLGMFIVVKGSVKIYKFSDEGREQVLAVEKPGGIVAELPLLDGLPYPASAVASEDCELLLVPKSQFHATLKKYPELALSIIRSISLRLRHLVTLIEEISFLQVRQRLARYLLAESAGRKEFEIRHTNAEIGSIIGTVRELVSRNLSRFAKEQIVEVKDKQVRILDLKKLEEIAGE